MNHRMPYPTTVADFNVRRPTFEAWLVEHGSAILAPTNEWEVIRFIGQNATCVVYSDSRQCIKDHHWQHGARGAFDAFTQKKPWRASKRTNIGQRKRINTVRSIAQRDGWTCAYCLCALDEDDATIEHFVALTHGGPDHLANQVLACQPCNAEASHLSAREKIEAAVRKRSGGREVLAPGRDHADLWHQENFWP